MNINSKDIKEIHIFHLRYINDDDNNNKQTIFKSDIPSFNYFSFVPNWVLVFLPLL